MRSSFIAMCVSWIAVTYIGPAMARADSVTTPMIQAPGLNLVEFTGSSGSGTFTANGTGVGINFSTASNNFIAIGDFNLSATLVDGAVSAGTLNISATDLIDMDSDPNVELPGLHQLFHANIKSVSYNAAIHVFEFSALSIGTSFSPAGTQLRGEIIVPFGALSNTPFNNSFSLTGPGDSLEGKASTAVPLPGVLPAGLILLGAAGSLPRKRMTRSKDVGEGLRGS